MYRYTSSVEIPLPLQKINFTELYKDDGQLEEIFQSKVLMTILIKINSFTLISLCTTLTMLLLLILYCTVVKFLKKKKRKSTKKIENISILIDSYHN